MKNKFLFLFAALIYSSFVFSVDGDIFPRTPKNFIHKNIINDKSEQNQFDSYESYCKSIFSRLRCKVNDNSFTAWKQLKKCDEQQDSEKCKEDLFKKIIKDIPSDSELFTNSFAALFLVHHVVKMCNERAGKLVYNLSELLVLFPLSLVVLDDSVQFLGFKYLSNKSPKK